ncbi:hypothetical protein [Porphyromonas sp.]
MQAKKVHLLYRAGRICLLSAVALLSLGSCRDDIQEPKKSTHEQTPQSSIDNYIGKVDIALEATLEPMPDQSGRGLSYRVMDRTERIGVDGNTVPAGKDYAGEFAPRMYLTEGSTTSGFLIFYHDSGKKVLRTGVTFTVIEGVKKADGTIDPTAKNRVQCVVKNLNFPAGYTLKDEFNKSTNAEVSKYPGRIPSTNTTKESGWHVMAMLDFQESTSYYYTADADATNPLNNRLLFGYSQTESYSIQGSQSTDNTPAHTGNSVYLNTPCASAWMPLYITKAPTKPAAPGKTPEEPAVTGVNLELRFKPQGVLLQYDLTSMAAETQDLREIGIVSNVLDFKGYYDLNSASIEEAFRTKDGDNYGLPKWVPDAPTMDEFSMHYAPSTEAPLSSGARVFPWDMPTLSSNRTPALENWSNPGTNKWNVENASVLSFYSLGNSDKASTGRPTSYPWLTTRKLWTFLTLGGSKTNGYTMGSQQLIYFWGMPRTADRMPQANKRATYLFASSHSLMTDEDAWNAEDDFDTKTFLDLLRLALRRSNDLDKLKTDAEQAAPEKKDSLEMLYRDTKTAYETQDRHNDYRAQFPGPVFAAAKNAMQKANDYLRNANKSSITPRTQPLMVLHQTNRTFPERKIYHAQVVIRPDLMLSEVIYQKHDGKNYSLLEVYNTTVEPVDLSQYAVVRLIPSADGSHLAFRDKDGHAVESLEHALVLPLTALKGKTDPFDGSTLTSLKQDGYNYDDPTNRAKPVYFRPYYTITLGGLWPGKWAYSAMVDESATHPDRSFYLLKGQSILLGGSGYVNTPVTKQRDGYIYTVDLIEPEGWFKPLHGLLETNYNRGYLRYAYAYADGVKGADGSFGEGTLDYRPGDAFALIKKTSTGWQIIDATGPVGPKHLAFAGSYSDFKTEMAKHESAQSFSLQRLDGVNYPFIAPFRTNRLYSSKWSDDWNILTDVNQFTPGRRFDYSGWEISFGNWNHQIKRTPIDTQFTTYQNARPTRGH